MDDVSIFILTHKDFPNDYPSCYIPIVCGNNEVNNPNFLRDDTGINISNLNEFFAELTGQYWVWKNNDSDIVGFCHYRRFFAKNILLNEKIDEKDIKNILNEYDIIAASDYVVSTNVEDHFKNAYIKSINKGARPKDFDMLRDLIKTDSPEYLNYFDEFMQSNRLHSGNMFICKRDFLDQYFSWLFPLLEKMLNKIDFNEYIEQNREKRVLGYFSEILFNVFIKKNNLKVNQKHIIFTESKFYHLFPLFYKYPFFRKIKDGVYDLSQIFK